MNCWRLLGATFTLLMTPLLAEAQGAKIWRVGSVGSPTTENQAYFEAFRAGMRELGYVEGRNLIIERRVTDPDMKQLPALVDEVIRLKPDVLIGTESVAVAMREKTSAIPIVLTNALNPVRAGLAQTLRRPGLNVTGSAQQNDVLAAKHVEIMREIRPRLARVGLLLDTNEAGCKAIEEAMQGAAKRIGATLVPYVVANREEIERAFAQMDKQRPDVLLPCPSSVLFNHRALLFESVVRLRIPMTSFVVANVPQGVLFAFAASIPEMMRRAATFVDRIIKGTQPGDIPIEQPTKFDLIINRKTAAALGIAIPQAVLLRADRVIE